MRLKLLPDPLGLLGFDNWPRQAYAIDTNQQRKINVEQKDLNQIKTIVTEAIQTGTENLAQMVATGFENTASKQDVEGVRHDVAGLHQDVENIRHDVAGVRGDISKLDERLIIVERKLDKALYREFERIDKLEKEMQVVKEKLGIPQ